jgi:U4/U6 small nuclear ribonucleoprotein PRP3
LSFGEQLGGEGEVQIT